MTKFNPVEKAKELYKRPEYKYKGFRIALNELDTAYRTAYKGYQERANKLMTDYQGQPPTSLIDENIKALRADISIMTDTFLRSIDTEYNRLYSDCEQKWNVMNTDITNSNISEFGNMVKLATDKELLNLIRNDNNIEPYKIRVLEQEIEARHNAELRTAVLSLTARKGKELEEINQYYRAYETISGIKRIGEISDRNYNYITSLHEQADRLGM